MSGRLLAMPLIIINMGGEMAYILQQRLVAQKIPNSKSHKVLHDVIRTMYNKKFITDFPKKLRRSRRAEPIAKIADITVDVKAM